VLAHHIARNTIAAQHLRGAFGGQYPEPEVGELGVQVLRAVKQTLDPAGIMNPGKLIP
jgi:alkyldihydroxyacetonephosphate synthase